MIKVRFHLGKGKNYLKWQVKSQEGVKYYDPETYSLYLTGCKLYNQKKTAERILKGSNKTVCAWIKADRVEVRKLYKKGDSRVSFNPRVKPHWVLNNEDADGKEFEFLFTSGREVFLKD